MARLAFFLLVVDGCAEAKGGKLFVGTWLTASDLGGIVICGDLRCVTRPSP